MNKKILQYGGILNHINICYKQQWRIYIYIYIFNIYILHCCLSLGIVRYGSSGAFVVVDCVRILQTGVHAELQVVLLLPTWPRTDATPLYSGSRIPERAT